jgi:hypothetical protein
MIKRNRKAEEKERLE